MVLSGAIDSRQEFGRHEPDLIKQAERGLQERLKHLCDLKVLLMLASTATIVALRFVVV